MQNYYSEEPSIKLSTANIYINAGRFFSILGSGLLITETIIGLFALDITILILLEKYRKEHGSDNGYFFFLGALYKNMSNNHWCLTGNSLLGIVLASFVQSIIAALILTIELHMPFIALAVATTWIATALMIYAGSQLQEHGKNLQSDALREQVSETYPAPYSQGPGFFSSPPPYGLHQNDTLIDGTPLIPSAPPL